MRNCLLLSEENYKLIKWSIKKCNLFRSIENVWHTQPKASFAEPLLEEVGTCQTGLPASGSRMFLLISSWGLLHLFHYNADSYFEKFMTMKLTLRMAASYTVE